MKHILLLALSPLNLVATVFLRDVKRAGFPSDRAEYASLETGLPFSDAVDSPEDGPSQQDVDPGV